MNDTKPIPRTPPTPKTLDYAYLLERGIARAQALSGDVWTDYNDHDPGVTILQQLCFALTDLAYRTEHPIEDILAPPSADKERSPPQAFYTGDRILTCNPLTTNDYRKLIYDRIQGVKNAWLEPIDDEASQLRGLYRVYLDLFDYPHRVEPSNGHEGEQKQKEEERRQEEKKREESIVDEVRDLLRCKRNLGEDFTSVEVVKPFVWTLHADVEVGPEEDAVDIVAKILFNVDLRLNPPPEVEDIDSLLQQDKPPEELFDGPRLTRGIIEDASLRERVSEMSLTRVMRIILGVDGVLSVRELGAEPFGLKTEAGKTVDPTEIIRGRYDLRLMSVDAPDDLEDEGNSLVIVGVVGTDLHLHIRIFDADGKKVVDRAENELIPGEALTALKDRLSPLPDESSLSQADKQEIIGYATSSAGAQPAVRVPRVDKRDTAIKRLRVYRGGVPITVDDFDRVRSSIRNLEQRRRWNVIYALRRMEDVAYKRVPWGNTGRQLDRYRSIQHLFPAVYGVGTHGVADSAIVSDAGEAPAREARRQRAGQARQLKAYLLFFEQLLANYLAQLANVSRFLSLDPQLDRTYFCQPIAHDPPKPDDPPDIEPVLGQQLEQPPEWLEEYQLGLRGIVGSQDPHRDRRERALDHLLARFNERFDDERLEQLHGTEGLGRDAFLDKRIDRKRDYLREYIELGGGRGSGVVYPTLGGLSPHGTPPQSVLQRRVTLLTGMQADFHVVEHILLRPGHHRPGIGELSIKHDFRVGRAEKVCALRISHGDWQLHWVLDKARTRQQWEALIVSDVSDAIYERDDWQVRVRLRDSGGRTIGDLFEGFASVRQAREATDGLSRLFDQIRRGAEPPAKYVQPVDLPLRFYAHRVSVILPAESDPGKSGFREFVEDTVTDNLPAHLSAECYWLQDAEMAAFEERYLAWIEARACLRSAEPAARNREDIVDEQARALRGFIAEQCHRNLRQARGRLWNAGLDSQLKDA